MTLLEDQSDVTERHHNETYETVCRQLAHRRDGEILDQDYVDMELPGRPKGAGAIRANRSSADILHTGMMASITNVYFHNIHLYTHNHSGNLHPTYIHTWNEILS